MNAALSRKDEPVEYQLISMAGHVQRFGRFLRQKWWIPLLTIILGLAAEWSYNHFRPPSVTAVSRMLVGGKVKIPEGGLYAEEWQNFFGTQVELMQSDKIRRRTLDRLERLKQSHNASPVRLEVSQLRKTTIFFLQATGKDEAYTTAYLNALMDEYLSYRKEVRALSSDDTLASLTSQFLEQEKELKRQQEALLAFQRTNSLTLLREQSSSGNLAKLNSQLADLKMQRALLVDTLQPPSTPSKEEGAASRPLLNPLDGRPKEVLAMLKFRKEQWGKVLRPEHPRMEKLEEDIARTEKLIAVYESGDKEQITFAKQSNDLKIEGIEKAIAETEAGMVAANRLLAEYSLMQQNLERVQNHYDHILHLLQNVGLDKNVDQETIVVMDPATPVAFKGSLVQRALSGIIGLIIGLGVVGLVSTRDDRLTSIDELKLQFPEAVLGQIPNIPSNRKAPGPLNLLEPHDQRHAFAEAYRAIRSSLLFMARTEPRPRVVLVTSAMPGEGKSTVAVNIARSLAFGGSNVLLIDGDLRTGSLHETLGLPCQPGLTQLQGQNVTSTQLTRSTSLSNLQFIPRGPDSVTCGELFVNSRLDRLLKDLSSAFDYILIDSAPVFAASDALSLVPKVDGIIFVLRDSFSRASLTREALNQLYQLQARVLGIVFNRANQSLRSNLKYREDKISKGPAMN